MAVPSRSGHRVLKFAAVAFMAALPALGQEPAGTKIASPGPDAKQPYEPARRVPDYFGQIGLTPKQKDDVYKVRARHQSRIDEMEKQIARARAEMMAECETLLTPTQKELLGNLREAAFEKRLARKKEQAKVRPVSETSKTPEKSAN